MTYEIKPYSYYKAELLGVKIKPSTRPKYKIDVFSHDNDYITSIGAIGYKDFPTYYEEKGEEYATKRRELYRNRHHKEKDKVGTRGYYSYNILW